MSVPGGYVDGLPVGVQLMAKPFDEASLFRAAYAYEQATSWGETNAAV
jgi:Asp-tRNA(Asn)/Glu-tRNA(Gln) amidotransferase A subunit family amidase